MMKRFLITLVLSLCFGANSFSQITGKWHSSFVVMGMSTRMTLEIDEDATFYMSSPDEEFPKAKMSKSYIHGDSIGFNWTSIYLDFDGVYYEDGDSIVGEMRQAGLKWSTTFTKTLQDKISVSRPQYPPKEVDYPVEEVEIENGSIILGATITMPKNFDENTPIIILASGSGPQNRDCELVGHHPFYVIAHYLAENGVGCLRFDDRGTGKSSGEFAKATLSDFASDINACFKYLKSQNSYKYCEIGVAGHSEGGMHALIAASKNKDLAFVIELASVGTSGKEILIEQQYLIPIQSGKSEEFAKFNSDAFRDACNIVELFDNQGDAADSLSSHLASMYDSAPEEFRAETSKFLFIMNLNTLLNNDWGREFLDFNASNYLSKVKVPLLSINGERDIQVPAESNYNAFKSFNYPSKASKKNKYVLADGLNHLMQHCTTCSIMEYGEIEETFSEEVMKIMADWVKGL